jgi:hypothetical protein
MVRLNRPPPRPAGPPQFGLTQPLRIVGSESDEGWQREVEARWYTQRGQHLIEAAWHPGEVEARAQISDDNDVALIWSDALRESIREREEIDSLVGEHADVDALASNLPALRVPSEDRSLDSCGWFGDGGQGSESDRAIPVPSKHRPGAALSRVPRAVALVARVRRLSELQAQAVSSEARDLGSPRV